MGGQLIFLLDPDTAGRRARLLLDDEFGPALHAFISTKDAAGLKKGKLNFGVEHAHPKHVRAALGRARMSDKDRAVFTASDLEALGLGQAFDAANDEKWAAWGGVSTRRQHVADCLGIGTCNLKQLVNCLNRYGFTREELMKAVGTCPELDESERAKRPGPRRPRSDDPLTEEEVALIEAAAAYIMGAQPLPA